MNQRKKTISTFKCHYVERKDTFGQPRRCRGSLQRSTKPYS